MLAFWPKNDVTILRDYQYPFSDTLSENKKQHRILKHKIKFLGHTVKIMMALQNKCDRCRWGKVRETEQLRRILPFQKVLFLIIKLLTSALQTRDNK